MPPNGRRAPARARTTAETRLREKAQKLSGAALDALQKLMAETEKTPATIRLAAAREILHSARGRPGWAARRRPAARRAA